MHLERSHYSWPRRMAIRITNQPDFGTVVILLIFANIITLAMYRPLEARARCARPPLCRALSPLNYVAAGGGERRENVRGQRWPPPSAGPSKPTASDAPFARASRFLGPLPPAALTCRPPAPLPAAPLPP